MKYLIAIAGVLAFLGAGCVAPVEPDTSGGDPTTGAPVVETDVTLPLSGDGPVGYLPVYKRFGEFFDDRFVGYHTGEDAEVPPDDDPLPPIPVLAVADGTVAYLSHVSGFGGVVILQHEFDGESIQTLYGHLDLDSTTLRTGDVVAKGQVMAILGEDKSEDTDGERRHLHFAVYRGAEVRLQGYVSSPVELDAWINPQDFFAEHGVTRPDPDLAEHDDVLSARDLLWYPSPTRRDVPLAHAAYGELDFEMPADWDVEYIPSLDALNLYEVSGAGTARERSKMLIRYFDANDFQTLSTVDVISTETVSVGVEDYDARRYEIVKKSGIEDFTDQPAWRNAQHVVTDFRAEAGFSRFYVVAANPDLDPAVYQGILDSIGADFFSA
ncbi:hypothetical protein A2348_01625 [Candidatus Uhrbacteria bacterium RIFOXYB12_FULL_58_10]|nr:MAG: hypothetical protein A2348_01625 [Candidatus Uhrbacteria bacterium RIFOXYB12_FULL_58_10]OGL99702.1 MAG: hypothetical protein A2501_00490 [Candidatus Uhrbacteria bacterium RIFOXYC12_FULL_57_11]